MTDPIFAGIEIGGTKLQIVYGDAKGDLIEKFQFKIEVEKGAKAIREKVEEIIIGNFPNDISAIGVGFGGPVDFTTGHIARSFQVEGWSDFNIIDWLRTIVDVPVIVDNDANVAALGEAVHGAGTDFQTVLYVTLGSGVGGGFVINKKIYHGKIPGEIEIGHLRLDRDGHTLESSCSGWAVDKKIRNFVLKNPSGILAHLVGGRTSGEAIFLKEAIEQGDGNAMDILEETADNLAFGLSHAVHILHPDLIILGGGLSFLGDILQQPVAEKLPTYLMESFSPGPPVIISALKEMAVPMGALVLASPMFQSK